jgi:hypothetical protein
VIGAAAFLSAPTFVTFRGLVPGVLEAKPAWRKDEDAAEGGMESDANAMLQGWIRPGVRF